MSTKGICDHRPVFCKVKCAYCGKYITEEDAGTSNVYFSFCSKACEEKQKVYMDNLQTNKQKHEKHEEIKQKAWEIYPEIFKLWAAVKVNGCFLKGWSRGDTINYAFEIAKEFCKYAKETEREN